MHLASRLRGKFPRLALTEDFSFARYTTIGCGGSAEAAAMPACAEEAAQLLTFLERERIPYCYLGAGANVLPAEGRFEGVVVRFCNMDTLYADGTSLYAGAGVTGGRLLAFAAANVIGGFEPFFGSPRKIFSQYGGDDYTAAVDLHKAVYNGRQDVNYIHHSDDENIKAFSAQKKALKPYLDDFAQLIGLTCRTAAFNPADTVKSSKEVVKKLKGRNAVLLKDNGALCVSGDRDDAEAIEMVLSKNINAAVAGAVFPGVKVINKVESALMRVVYKTKYSKQKNK